MSASPAAPPPAPASRPPALAADPVAETARLLVNEVVREQFVRALDPRARAALGRMLAPPAPDPLLRMTPPNDVDAERSVLGALLIDANAVDEVAPILRPELFYRPAHVAIYTAVLDMRRRGDPVDVTLLNAELTKRGTLEAVGGTVALAELTQAVPTAANAAYYARLVRDHAARRDLIRATAQVQRDAFDAEIPAAELLVRAEAEFMKAGGQQDRPAATGRDLARDLWNTILRTERREVPLGWLTGYHQLDDELGGGLQPGDLSAIGARTSMGKTTFLLALVAHLLESGHRVGVVSLEMPCLQLARNIAASRARVDGQRVRSTAFTAEERERVNEACGWLDEVGDRLVVDDAPPGSASSILARVRKLVTRNRCQIVFVDYLQRVQLEDPTQQHVELGALSGALKTVAVRYGAHVSIVVQLSRKVEDRRDHTPMLSDIGGSGQIEADLDLALMLYRPSYYAKKLEPGDPLLKLLEVHIAKQRNGPVGVVPLWFDRECLRIEDWPENESVPEGPLRKKKPKKKGAKPGPGDDQGEDE